ncbi:hypothetical protein [Labrenzia sp. OB1]|uniref:hypothetical protein n=1 Tax=Labrenzia sp. OB1 TaxID=1561204 RepID=UPI0007B24DB6|nr:hypothetical protein [Labrenzia sp. OB1]KZM48273.1 hypothetical protein OA90_21190 [Labrenzia sp. OB1]
MELLGQYGAQLVAFGLAVLLALAKYFFQPKVKLVWGRSHGFLHNVTLEKVVDDQNDYILIGTSYHLLSNAGRKAATDVEVTFNYIPKNFEVWPQRQYETSVNPNGRFIVCFGGIAPKEQVSLNVLTFTNEAPAILSVRSKETTGKAIPLTVIRLLPAWGQMLVLFLLVLGLAAGIYLLIELIGLFAVLSSAQPAILLGPTPAVSP